MGPDVVQEPFVEECFTTAAGTVNEECGRRPLVHGRDDSVEGIELALIKIAPVRKGGVKKIGKA